MPYFVSYIVRHIFIRHLLVSHSRKGFLGELYVRSCGYRFTSCNRMDGLVTKWLEQ